MKQNDSLCGNIKFRFEAVKINLLLSFRGFFFQGKLEVTRNRELYTWPSLNGTVNCFNMSNTLVFFQRDRITSFRKTGMKKEKPLIQHPTDPLSTQSELPVPQPLFDDRSMNLSEKEIIDLFEKMMVSFAHLLKCFPWIQTCLALHNSLIATATE